MTQQEAIMNLYLRDDIPLPRGALRLKPNQNRRGVDGVPPCESLSELIGFCVHNKDVYINLFSDWQKEHSIYDIIFLDIDNENLQDSLDDTIRILTKLQAAGIEHYNVYFSGSKGFHIYIQMEPTKLNNYRVAVTGFLQELKIWQYIDKVVVEANRVTRVPYSINTKTGMMCRPMNDIMEVDVEHLAKADGTDRILQVNQGLGARVKVHDGELVDYGSMEYDRKSSEIFSDADSYPDCMRELIADAMEGIHLNHVQRLEMAKFLLHVHGYDLDEVKKYFAHQHNYVESKTKYQLEYIAHRDLKLMNCKSMDDYGLCPLADQKDCPFAPTLNSFIREEMING